MFGSNREIKAGDGSTNIQGQTVHVNNNGLSYTDVKEVANDVFERNFYKLGEEAAELAQKRAEDLVNNYLEKLNIETPNSINNTNDPDIQYAIYNAQKAHARLGDEEISRLLVKVLVDRTKSVDNSLLNIVLNETIEIIPKLTTKQIDTLTFLFLVEDLILINDLPGYLDLVKKFTPDYQQDLKFYRHLQYTGCLSISVGEKNIYKIIELKYSGLLANQDVKSIINGMDNDFEKVDLYWNTSRAKHSSLTSVGVAIGYANLFNKTGFQLEGDLSIFINE
ncbi:LPO_1073/Vpar_1526 family protein [Peribacillus sp. NPDC058002]|uniref:LPO_1073/Vpar_1526 family protein n=1 Tax=Peribacillus sp. NPDC058002 TaxID=3346301 RepID=UPI0036DCE5DC